MIDNPINRYIINYQMLPSPKKGKDGFLRLYIQKNSPGRDEDATLLPTPDANDVMLGCPLTRDNNGGFGSQADVFNVASCGFDA